MDCEEDWNAFLKGHPIFSSSRGVSATHNKDELSFELSLSSLPDFTKEDRLDDSPAPSGRRQVMVIKDSELIVAAGSEIRMASLGDSKLTKSQRRSYKVCMFFLSQYTYLTLTIPTNEIYIGFEYTKRYIRYPSNDRES